MRLKFAAATAAALVALSPVIVACGDNEPDDDYAGQQPTTPVSMTNERVITDTNGVPLYCIYGEDENPNVCDGLPGVPYEVDDDLTYGSDPAVNMIIGYFWYHNLTNPYLHRLQGKVKSHNRKYGSKIGRDPRLNRYRSGGGYGSTSRYPTYPTQKRTSVPTYPVAPKMPTKAPTGGSYTPPKSSGGGNNKAPARPAPAPPKRKQ
jgi:hypothetical protein